LASTVGEDAADRGEEGLDGGIGGAVDGDGVLALVVGIEARAPAALLAAVPGQRVLGVGDEQDGSPCGVYDGDALSATGAADLHGIAVLQ